MSITFFVTSEHKDELGPGRLVKFGPDGGSIGRADGNDWILPDPTRIVSSRHARIDCKKGRYYLIDTSKNGVFVNDGDRPVGSSKPQVLDNGDRLRIGSYEIMVSIEEDDSMEIEAPGGAITSVPQEQSDVAKKNNGGGTARHKETKRKRPTPKAKAPADVEPRDTPDVEVASAFLEGLGVDPGVIHEGSEVEMMKLCGQLFREAVEGIREGLTKRAEEKEQYRLSQTTIQSGDNNPLKFSASTEEALKNLIFEQSPGYLPPIETIRDSFRGLRIHREAIRNAMQIAIEDFLGRFDPTELKKKFDQNLDAGVLKAGNKSKYWDCYKEMYDSINQRTAGELPLRFSEVFINAYQEYLENAGGR